MTDPGLFDLQVNGSTELADAVPDGDTTGPVKVAVGSNPTVGEVAGTGTDLDDYVSSIACSGRQHRFGVRRRSALPRRPSPPATRGLHDHQQAQAAPGGRQGARPVRRRRDVRPADRRRDREGGCRQRRGATGFVSVATGTHLSLSELRPAPPPTLGDYETEISCDNGDTNAPAAVLRASDDDRSWTTATR